VLELLFRRKQGTAALGADISSFIKVVAVDFPISPTAKGHFVLFIYFKKTPIKFFTV